MSHRISEWTDEKESTAEVSELDRKGYGWRVESLDLEYWERDGLTDVAMKNLIIDLDDSDEDSDIDSDIFLWMN